MNDALLHEPDRNAGLSPATQAPEPADLLAIPPRSLRYYLKAQGWRRTGQYGEHAHVYGRTDTDTELLVPGSSGLADYARRVYELAHFLGQVEERASRDVLRDLASAEMDLVRVELSEVHTGPSIPLAHATLLLTEAQNLLRAAARSVAEAQRAFRSEWYKAASDYLKTVHIGQIERGRFISLLSPAPSNLVEPVQPGLPPAEPTTFFGRQVMHKLNSGLRAARDAVRETDSGCGISSFEDRTHDGVSANLCSAAATLIERGRGLVVSISWALSRPEPGGRAVTRFDASDAPVLEEASRLLKSRQERPNERIEGYVSRLARDETATEGAVTIKAPIDGQLTSVKVAFGPKDYGLVSQAHTERQTVLLEGDLRREGSRWHLHNPRDLVLLLDDDG